MVYYSENQAVDAVEPVKGVPGCDALVRTWMIENHRTKPGQGKIRDVERVSISFPPGIKPKNVPPHVLDEEAIEKPEPGLPDAVKKRATGYIIGMYKMCFGTDGAAIKVTPLQSVGEGEESVEATLLKWRLRPQPIPICTLVRLVFDYAPRKKK